MDPVVGEGPSGRREMPAASFRRKVAIIDSKVTVPRLSDDVIDRPRVQQSLAGLIRTSRAVLVTATAGAGKTTAVASAAALVAPVVIRLVSNAPSALCCTQPHMPATVGATPRAISNAGRGNDAPTQ